MKKIVICIALAFVLVMGLSSTSMAAALRLDASEWCNDYYLGIAKAATNVYDCHGYEYGCGYSNRLVDGVFYVTGGYGYFGLVGSYGAGDGSIHMCNAVLTMSTKTGPGVWMYTSVSSSWGGTGTYTMVYPAEPPAGATEALDPDSAVE